MVELDDFSQRRIMRRPSTKLIEKDGYVILGPDFADIVKKFMAFIFVSEAAVVTAIAVCVLLWFLNILDGIVVLAALIFAFGLIQFAQIAGLAIVIRHKLKKHTRFTLHPEGEIIVKDTKYNDITLEPDPAIEFVCTPGTDRRADRRGDEIYDVALKHASGTYYLLSGEKDAMEKLCVELKKASAPFG